MKDGAPLEESAKFVHSSDGKKNFKLEITNVTVADVGQYSLKIAGKKSESAASFSLNVVVDPVYVRLPA